MRCKNRNFIIIPYHFSLECQKILTKGAHQPLLNSSIWWKRPIRAGSVFPFRLVVVVAYFLLLLVKLRTFHIRHCIDKQQKNEIETKK